MLRQSRFILLLAASMPLLSIAQKQGQERIDSLVALLPAMADDSMKVKLLEEISYSYYNIDPDKGVDFGRRSLHLAERIGWKRGMAAAYSTIGINYGFGKSDFPNALDNYLKSLALQEQRHDTIQIAGLLNNIGAVHDEMNDDAKALEFYERALAICRRMGRTDWIANNLSNIGGVYTKKKDFAKAMAYKREALALKREVGDAWGIATNTTQLARIHGELGQLDSALLLLRVALPMYQEMGDKQNMAQVYEQMGTVHLYLARKDAANKRRHLLDALTYTDSALTISLEAKHVQSIADGYHARSEIKHALGSDQEAWEDGRLAEMYKDSVFSLERDKKLVQQAMQYEFDKKETADKAAQEKKDAIAEEELQRKDRQRNVLLVFGAFAMVFAAVDYRRRQRIKKEHARSEALLLNILPTEVARELKDTGAAQA
ncbi:MAG TPA: tetratricopeptide repeat protein, partial [Flavobacteriales bacterium]|nr:tetratricopeptide repeat protein [Flavobacteriales bacterium]